MRPERVFVRLDEFEFDEFLQHALPSLERVDPIGLLNLISQKLERAVKAAFPIGADTYPGHSSTWVRDLDQSDPTDGELPQLARAVCGVARRAASCAENVDIVLTLLERHDHEVFQRIRLRVLAAAGEHTRERVDAFFSDRRTLEPPFRGREIAAVARAQFVNASPEAQAAFVRHLEAGPSDRAQDVGEAAADDANGQALLAWQRTRLLWLRDSIPDALQGLASRLGVTSQQHSPHDAGLAEDGFYIGSGFVGEKSPVSVDQLRAMDDGAFVEFVLTWQPDVSYPVSPTREGLHRVHADYATQYPVDALSRGELLASRLETADARLATHINGLLDGLRASISAGNHIDWRRLLGLLAVLWAGIDGHVADEDSRSIVRPWRWLATAIVDLITAASRRNAAPDGHAGQLWELAEAVITSTHTWTASEGVGLGSFADVLSAALNDSGGRATEAALEVACAVFRSTLAIPERDATPQQLTVAANAVAPRLEPLLEHVLKQDGRGAIAAQAVIGSYLPQIHLLARDWLLSAAPRLFTGGTETPVRYPAWGAYVTRASMFRDVFRDLRPWYLRAAADMPILAKHDLKRDQWSLTEHLAGHVFSAYIAGLIDIEDDDQLLVTVFANLPPQERAHISWQVFRNWTDSRQPIGEQTADRLLRFWRWRLDRLQDDPDSSATQQDLVGLAWFICTPFLPEGTVLELGYRTLKMSGGDAAAHGAIWERLTELCNVDVDRVFDMAELLVQGALSKPYAHITLDQTGAVLSRALKSSKEDTRDRAARLIHSLGDRGHVEFGRLLAEA